MTPIAPATAAPQATASPELKRAFQRVIGGMFYGQLLKALRQTAGKPAYIHGGQAEEMFQSQLDQTVIEELAEHPGGPWVDELFQQFLVQLNGRSASGQPLQITQPAAPASPSPQEELAEAARQTQPAPEGAGIKSAAAVTSALFRK